MIDYSAAGAGSPGGGENGFTAESRAQVVTSIGIQKRGKKRKQLLQLRRSSLPKPSSSDAVNGTSADASLLLRRASVRELPVQ